MRYKTAVDKTGRIAAMEVAFLIDGGAYCTLSPVVLSRGVLHCTGFYDIPNVAVTGRAMATNTPPKGAFRGFGAPQALFGIERHMDEIAAGALPGAAARTQPADGGLHHPHRSAPGRGGGAAAPLRRNAAALRLCRTAQSAGGRERP